MTLRNLIPALTIPWVTIANSQDLITQEDQELIIILSAFDIDSDILLYNITQSPDNGSISIIENIDESMLSERVMEIHDDIINTV